MGKGREGEKGRGGGGLYNSAGDVGCTGLLPCLLAMAAGIFS